MAFQLEREGTVSTPYVLVDEEKGYMRLEGRCFHENVGEFFEEINEWLDGYLVSGFGRFTFDCAITYFNSSTTKLLLNLLKKLDENALGEKEIFVNWIAEEDNDIMIECGEDFEEDMNNLAFRFVMLD